MTTQTIARLPSPGCREENLHQGLRYVLAVFLGIFSFLSTDAWTMEKKTPTKEAGNSQSLLWVEGEKVRVGIDRVSGLMSQVETVAGQATMSWLQRPIGFTVRHEITNTAVSLRGVDVKQTSAGISVGGKLNPLSLTVSQHWSSTRSGIAWQLQFEGTGKRAGHEVTIDLPLLTPDLHIFTPSNRGVMALNAYPEFQHVPYATHGLSWEVRHAYYVLPLVSVFNLKQDTALTIALPADAQIPHLQVSWNDSHTLRLTLAHRGMGGGQDSGLKLLFYTHAADYRSVLKAYSDDFPSYFRPTLPRGPYEGAFYYHHIQDHPSLEEMARQRIRYIWTFPWFTHVGEYLPEEKEWKPYSYSNWWRLGEMMNDDKIRNFARTMNAQGVGVYAHMCLNEFGGPGSYDGVEESGDSDKIEKVRKSLFPKAMVKDKQGREIGSWEGCRVMNPDRRYGFFSYLLDQVRGHMKRLPELQGFVIDRLDWSSIYDYGHDDGLTMVGEKTVASMAVPMAEIIQEFCRINHEAGKRVFVNHSYRIEIVRDVDGYCYEIEFLPALSYLAPYRPLSAWNFRKYYHGDLFQFEAQLKRRVQFAVFPHMIAHEFPICQQPPDKRAADLLEIYAPLFDTLIGKEQVLLPHCIAVTGANDVNLYLNGEGRYVVPVTSRIRFLSRRVHSTETVTVRLNVPDGPDLKWAHVYSADTSPYRTVIRQEASAVRVEIQHHGSTSILVVGKGIEPELKEAEAVRLDRLRDTLFPPAGLASISASKQPTANAARQFFIRIEGTHVGEWGTVAVRVDGIKVGQISSGFGIFALNQTKYQALSTPPRVTLVTPDEGIWFAPEKAELISSQPNGEETVLAEWNPEDPVIRGDSFGELDLPLEWREKGTARLGNH